MVRARGFSIVLHDVQNGRKTKQDVCDFVVSYKVRQYVVAEEPYNHQEGSHIHVFIQMSQPVQFKMMLDRWCKFWGSTGRVQVDQMRGSMASACKYVNGQARKQKAYDPDPVVSLIGEDAEEASVEDAELIWLYGRDVVSCPDCYPVRWKAGEPIMFYIECEKHFKTFNLAALPRPK